MINFLAKIFIKDYKNIDNPKVQSDYIAISGYLGLLLNVFLVLIKLIAGTLSGSIAMISDAFNNFSDSLTSIIAIVGSVFSRKPADKEHPHGHGRGEYVSSLLVSVVILYVAIELFKQSVEKIINPSGFVLSTVSIIILVISILVKVYMFIYNKRLANKISSVINDGVAKDSLNDVFATSGILICAFISKILKFNLDGYAGVLIAILVFKTGYEFAKSTISLIIGEAPEEALRDKIKYEVKRGKYIKDFHDLLVHNYGRGRVVASLHAEVPVDVSIVDIHQSIDEIERNVKEKTGVDLTIHMDPVYKYKEKEIRGKFDTKIVGILDVEMEEKKIREASEIIKEGELVVMPTETVYGLAADGLNPKAVAKIFEVKNRPQDNPLILHIAKKEDIKRLSIQDDERIQILTDKLWPGPLTIILKRSDTVPDIVTAGGDTVAIRLPDNEIARKLIEFSETPLAAPSANLSGSPSPTNAVDVYQDLAGRVKMILDGGSSRIGIESTVVDLSEDTASILRPGFYGIDTIADLIGELYYDNALVKEGQVPKSPGQKYKHYAPKADVILYLEDSKKPVTLMLEDEKKYLQEGKKVGIMTFSENINMFSSSNIINLGSRYELQSMARTIFSGLRELDRNNVDLVLIQGVEEKGLGFAIMNRLKKSCGGNIRGGK